LERVQDPVARTIERLDQLAKIGRVSGQTGTTRPGLSSEEQQACELVASWMEEDGLTTSWDGAGNLFGRLPGSDPSRAEIWTGSHLDTVPNGGRFDGALGVVVGLEAVAALREGGPPSTLAVVSFRYEEGWRFGGGCFGSRAICGALPPSELTTTDANGVSVRDALEALGFSGPGPAEPLPGSFVEAHIEQGPVLEGEDIPHGVVTAIAGMAGFAVTFTGASGHAGTVPLADRKDAFLAAAGFAVELREEALRVPGAVATIGDVRIPGGARNVVPGVVRASVDVRAPTSEALTSLVDAVPRLAQGAAARSGCSFETELRWLTEPVPMSAQVRAAIHESAAELNVPIVDLPSGAGHDAGILAARGVPTGMLFVRSLNGGVSHRPDELTGHDDIATAISVLTGTLARLGGAKQHRNPRIRRPSFQPS
jgi:hydantoinase/carbamoylase family amidase